MSDPLHVDDATLKCQKSVSFHPDTVCLSHSQQNNTKLSHLSEQAWESRESISGYVAQDGGDEGEGIREGYYKRLYRFYEKYNPQKLNRVEEYLQSYRGEEEQLFAILVGKYGPEPVDRGNEINNSILSSECESVMHYSGKRCRFPKQVDPSEGNTDCVTPYWAGGSTLISDRDLLSLLQRLETPNSELQKCYMGLFGQHPTESWNGMVYITRTEGIAPPDQFFVGHRWVGTLGSGKILVHEGKKYQRVTLYCSEECQKQGGHERWRLSVYRSDANSLILLRTVWDPIVVPEPVPLSRSNFSEVEFHSSSEVLPSRLSSMSSDRSNNPQPIQPNQPPVVATLAHFSKILEVMEARICQRLDSLENRLSLVEQRLDSSH